ncbi:MAG TPA: hypothetical protein DD727_03725 [Clostridiales bacterium]|nr:hypothetical protein [Clostridiales bacterium]
MGCVFSVPSGDVSWFIQQRRFCSRKNFIILTGGWQVSGGRYPEGDITGGNWRGLFPDLCQEQMGSAIYSHNYQIWDQLIIHTIIR